RQGKASPLNHCGQSVARSWKPMCSCRLLRNPGRLPKSPRMFLSLVLYHNNPRANSEPPKDREKIKASVSSASLRLFVFSPISTAICNAVAAPLCWGVFASSTATERRGYNLRRMCQPSVTPSSSRCHPASVLAHTQAQDRRLPQQVLLQFPPEIFRDVVWQSACRATER